MALRLASPADVARLDALARRVGLGLDAARELGHAHAELWLLEEGGALLGFALGWFVADELEVVDVAVDVPARRRGHGHTLLAWLLERGRARGARSAILEVRASGAAAQALYRGLGFEREGERARYYADGEDAWLFRCCLTPSEPADSAR